MTDRASQFAQLFLQLIFKHIFVAVGVPENVPDIPFVSELDVYASLQSLLFEAEHDQPEHEMPLDQSYDT